MKGLLMKDSLVLIKQLKIFLIIIPVIALIGNASMASIAILIGASLPMTAMAYDEQSKWENLARMMPYSKEDLILCKYILGYLGMLGTTLIYIIIQGLITIFTNGNFENILYPVSFAVTCGLLFIAINTPLLFRYGTQKGRYLLILYIGLSTGLGTFIKGAAPDISIYISFITPTVVIIAAIILNIVSIFISLRFKKK